MNEDSARKGYFKVESKKHNKLSLISKGLLISKSKPMLGASVDNIRTCRCNEGCEDVVVEYKCSWKHRNITAKEAFVTPEIGGKVEDSIFTLKTTASYYFQVQHQMFVCELKLCDFVVWTEKGLFVVPVAYNEEFVLNMCQKVECFWLNHVLPVMVNEITEMNCDNISGK